MENRVSVEERYSSRLRKADPAYEIFEPRVRAEAIEHRPDVREGEIMFSALVRFFQPKEGLVRIAQFRIVLLQSATPI